jgi:hypothetical protein
MCVCVLVCVCVCVHVCVHTGTGRFAQYGQPLVSPHKLEGHTAG